MEHDEKPLPIDTRLLGALAEKVSFASAVCAVWHFFFHSHDTHSNYLLVSSICKSPPL